MAVCSTIIKPNNMLTRRYYREITSIDPAIHWFCPRSNDDDADGYYDEDALAILPNETDDDKAIRLSRIQEAEERKHTFLEACKILAYDGGDAKQYADMLIAGLKTQLTRCDVCVREYHRARIQLQHNLETVFDPEEVRLFMDKFDAMNKDRISSGLNIMTETLVDLPPEERNIMAAGEVGMYAMFEALNCVPFLEDEEALQQYFDKPFKLVQNRKKVKLPSYAPGMTAWLFSSNVDRSSWAFRNFTGIKRDMTQSEFDFSVKPFLERAMTRVSIVNLELNFLPGFWRATRLILSKMPKEVVTNGLRAMDANLYAEAMEHFQLNAAHYADLISSFQRLLELSPTDFWDAMGTISPQAVIENIFKSPVLEKMLVITDEREPLKLEEKLAWVVPFVKSIKPANLVPPVRALLDQLFQRFQKDQYSRYARTVSWKYGLGSLLEALKAMKQMRGGPVATHLLQVVSRDYVHLIMQDLHGIEQKDEERMDDSESNCLQIIEAALSLDVQSLAHDRQTIVQTKGLDHELGVSGLNIWKMSMRAIKPGHPHLPAAIAAGIAGLLPLEKLTSRQVQAAPKPAEGWNNALNRVLVYTVDDFLERLQAFSPDQLADLYNDPKAANGILSLLFSGEQRVHQPMLSALKILTGEDARRETMLHLVNNKHFFQKTLTGATSAMTAIAKARVFGPCSVMLKLCSDLFSSLCDSSDGVLRTKTMEHKADTRALEEFWQMTWKTLNVIFEQTEPWSNLGYDKLMMHEFCRETMDFADYAFDQYSIIANTLRAATSSNAKGIGKQLLEHPKTTFANTTKWLRLRDEYLVGKAVGLTCKMLLRLQDVGIEVDGRASEYIEEVLMGKVKTKLTQNQLAEIQQALEKHLGATVAGVIDLEAPTSKKQSSLADWASGRSRSSTPNDVARVKKGVIDVDAWSDAAKRKKADQVSLDKEMEKLIGSVSSGSEAYKRRPELQGKKAMGQATVRAAQQQNDKKMEAFKLKRQQEKEAAEKSRAAALAKAKGVTAGSGVAGLGDIGKDHTLKGQNVMVSSDEESEDDDDEDVDDDLFGIKTKEKKRLQLPNTNGVIGLKPEQKKGPTRIQRTQRSVKDMRARLAPNLESLHTVILKWDFFHTGDYPPGSNEYQFQQVSNSFTDPTSYQNTFESLLILEAWQGMIKSREENASKPYEVKVQNRSNVDAFVELSSIVSHQENRELQLSEGDIILFSKAKKPTEDPSAPHCLARIYRLKRQKAHIEVIYQIVPNTSLAPALTMQALVYGIKVQSIIPLEREYGALRALQYYDLCQQIIKARPSNRINFSDKQIQMCQDVWNVNRAQSEAINAALENEGFSLIQGPPGSGKTKTIVAIVGGLLSSTLGSTSGASRINVPGAANGTRGADAPSKKLLVCAPSNAAVDELVMRLKGGVKTKSGRLHQLNVVRIGRSEAINTQVLDLTMDELVAKKLGNTGSDEKTRQRNAELFKEHEKVSAELRDLHQKRESGELIGKEAENIGDAIANVRKRKNELGVKIDNVKDQEKTAGREAELNRKRAQQAVLEEADVICATLSGSGHDMFQSLNVEFETVIIDEAAQCVEMSSLIPLKYGCIKCIMVGDPKQLPPTVFSKEAARFQYEQSLFVRMQNNFADEVHLLDTQYRMHPEISLFPSQAFYDGRLKDGQGMKELRSQPWHASQLLAPYMFFDVAGEHSAAPKGHSLVNKKEVEVATAIYDRVVTDFRSFDFKGRIGIITPYKSQLRLLKERFSARYGNEIFETVEFNTTDAFQGRESEIIIFSCVRASNAGGIGFLQDIRRMNVGLTRAKSSLWVLGNSQSLVRGQYWKKLVNDAKARECYVSGDFMDKLSRPSSMYPATISKTKLKPEAGSPGQGNGAYPSGWSSLSALNHPSFGDNSTPTELGRQPSATVTKQSEPLNARMEGVQYRFEDHVSKKRPPPDASNGNAHRQRLASEDVEMTDADSLGGTATPTWLDGTKSASPSETSGAVSRAETPLSAVSGEEKLAAQVNGSSRTKPPHVAPTAPQPLVRKKKKPADPFLTQRKR